jgi:hypothetical protein
MILIFEFMLLMICFDNEFNGDSYSDMPELFTKFLTVMRTSLGDSKLPGYSNWSSQMDSDPHMSRIMIVCLWIVWLVIIYIM